MSRRGNLRRIMNDFLQERSKNGVKSAKIKNDKKNAFFPLKVTKNAKRHFPKISDIWTPKTSRFGVSATIWSH